MKHHVFRQAAVLRRVLVRARQHSCLLCCAEARYRGVFLLNDSVAWGARAGKQRACVYALCAACSQRPAEERNSAVEERLRSQLCQQQALWN